MIQVIIRQGSIQVTGHAGAGPPGHDLVCAAVSTLVQTFVRSAEELTDHYTATLRPAGRLSDMRDRRRCSCWPIPFLLACRGWRRLIPSAYKS